jgi:hypothetical protein
MKHLIIYFILNSSYYEMPLLPDMTRDEAIKMELVPKGAKEITKEEFEKVINIQLDEKKNKNKAKK